MTAVDVSVVIVTWNSEREIGDCLDSLLSSKADNEVGAPIPKEIFVIDNHSEDDTVGEVRKRVAAGAPIHLIENVANEGFTKALNQGLTRCRKEWVLLLNPDTKLLPGALEQLVHFLQRHPEVGIVAPQLLFPNGQVQPSCRRFPRHRDVVFEVAGLSCLFRGSALFGGWKMGDFDHRATREVDQPQGSCLLTRRRVFEEVGLFDERFRMFFSDVDWCHRVKARGWKVVFYPEAQVMHRKGASVYRNRSAMIKQSHRDFRTYFVKYYPQHCLANRLVGAILSIAGPVRIAFAKISTPEI